MVDNSYTKKRNPFAPPHIFRQDAVKYSVCVYLDTETPDDEARIRRWENGRSYMDYLLAQKPQDPRLLKLYGEVTMGWRRLRKNIVVNGHPSVQYRDDRPEGKYILMVGPYTIVGSCDTAHVEPMLEDGRSYKEFLARIVESFVLVH